MNPMREIHVRARDGGLPQGIEAEYFSSEAFAERIDFKGEQGLKDKVSMLLYMLEHVALSPLDAQRVMAGLERGLVHLVFFGWGDPVGMLSLEVGGEDLEKIRSAAEANIAGARYEAAVRVLKWRQRQAKWRQGMDKVIGRLREETRWSIGTDAAAREVNRKLMDLLDSKANSIRDRRLQRLAMLRRAAGPKQDSWTGFLEALAMATLMPGQGRVGGVQLP